MIVYGNSTCACRVVAKGDRASVPQATLGSSLNRQPGAFRRFPPLRLREDLDARTLGCLKPWRLLPLPDAELKRFLEVCFGAVHDTQPKKPAQASSEQSSLRNNDRLGLS